MLLVAPAKEAMLTCHSAQLRRAPLRSNHTATHILNFGLREVLGDHIDQRGSLVAPSKLRFDFSHKAGIPLPELTKIEKMCNAWIARNVPVYSSELSLEQAYKIPGLRAVFGEAYPDPVRVVTLEFDVKDMAKDIENPKWRSTSVEFCGGTHVAKTGDIRKFVIVEESGIAKGIRRVVAVTGEEAAAVTRAADAQDAELAAIEKQERAEKEGSIKAFAQAIATMELGSIRKAALVERTAVLRKQIDADAKARTNAETKEVQAYVTKFFADNKEANLLIHKFDVGSNAKALQMGLQTAKKLHKAAYFFSEEALPGAAQTAADGVSTKAKVTHANVVPKQDLDKGLDAREWAEVVTMAIGGRGGGRPDGAQGVGEEGGLAVEEAIIAAERFYTLKAVDSKIPPA